MFERVCTAALAVHFYFVMLMIEIALWIKGVFLFLSNFAPSMAGFLNEKRYSPVVSPSLR